MEERETFKNNNLTISVPVVLKKKDKATLKPLVKSVVEQKKRGRKKNPILTFTRQEGDFTIVFD
jgi:hypothetical protein